MELRTRKSMAIPMPRSSYRVVRGYSDQLFHLTYNIYPKKHFFAKFQNFLLANAVLAIYSTMSGFSMTYTVGVAARQTFFSGYIGIAPPMGLFRYTNFKKYFRYV